ncbi:hypothetical protein B0H14DRAFT_2679302, partial [Mycena olivaceomarginata]
MYPVPRIRASFVPRVDASRARPIELCHPQAQAGAYGSPAPAPFAPCSSDDVMSCHATVTHHEYSATRARARACTYVRAGTRTGRTKQAKKTRREARTHAGNPVAYSYSKGLVWPDRGAVRRGGGKGREKELLDVSAAHLVSCIPAARKWTRRRALLLVRNVDDDD